VVIMGQETITLEVVPEVMRLTLVILPEVMRLTLVILLEDNKPSSNPGNNNPGDTGGNTSTK